MHPLENAANVSAGAQATAADTSWHLSEAVNSLFQKVSDATLPLFRFWQAAQVATEGPTTTDTLAVRPQIVSVPLSTPPNQVIPEPNQTQVMLAASFGGAQYNETMGAVIPNDPKLIHKAWKRVKDEISQLIGEIHPKHSTQTFSWRNSATDAKTLLQDAMRAKPLFRHALRMLAARVGGQANFGPGGKYATKTYESLRKKIRDDARMEGIGRTQAAAKIGDALRGTIIVDSPVQFRQTVQEVNAWVESQGGKVVWKNVFAEERPNGYVAAHAKDC